MSDLYRPALVFSHKKTRKTHENHPKQNTETYILFPFSKPELESPQNGKNGTGPETQYLPPVPDGGVMSRSLQI